MKAKLKIYEENLQVNNNELLRGQFRTYLNASVASASGTITVSDISGVAVDNYLLIGRFGDPDSEIVLTHTSSAPSGSTITLAANTVKAHTESDPVYLIDWNQVEFSRAATTGGSKVVLGSAQAIDATLEHSVYNDTTNTTGFGYARFKNVIAGNTFSEYSVEVPYTGLAAGTVGEAIQSVYEEFKLSPDYKFALTQANDCLDDINSRKKNWTPSRVLNESLGATSDLSYSFSLPSAIREPDNANSIIEVRLGDKELPLLYVDYQTFKLALDASNLTTLNGAASAGDLTITLTDSNDFDESGTIHVVGNTDGITYTSNAESTGVLSGVPASGTGSITATLATGANIWQDMDEGEPNFWTLDSSGNLLIDPLPDSNWINKNIYIDYFADVTSVDDIADVLDVRRYNLFKMWLRWKLRAELENNGVPSTKDPDFQRYESALQREVKFDKGDKLHVFQNVRDVATKQVKGFDISRFQE